MVGVCIIPIAMPANRNRRYCRLLWRASGGLLAAHVMGIRLVARAAGNRSRQNTIHRSILLGMLGIGALGSSVSAQQQALLNGVLSDEESAELAEWSTMYSHLLTEGTPADGAAVFEFTNPIMNSVYFSMRHAAARTVSNATGEPIDSCFVVVGQAVNLQAYSGIEDITAFIDEHVVETDLAADPQAGVQHLNVIANAQGPVDSFISGTTLISLGLPPTPVSTSADAGPIVTVSQPTQSWIDLVGQLGVDVALETDYLHANQVELMGGLTVSHQFMAELESAMHRNAPAGDAGSWSVSPADAVFGIFGRLPLAIVAFDDGVILVDATTGTVAGPYAPDAPLSASSLLALHGDLYDVGTPQGVVSASACAAPSWKLGPPPGTIAPNPAIPVPPSGPLARYPWTPPTPNPAPYPSPSPVNHDWHTPYHYTLRTCTGTASTCHCVAYGENFLAPPGKIVKFRRMCSANVGCSGENGSKPDSTPQYPKPVSQPPAAWGPCTTEWWY